MKALYDSLKSTKKLTEKDVHFLENFNFQREKDKLAFLSLIYYHFSKDKLKLPFTKKGKDMFVKIENLPKDLQSKLYFFVMSIEN